MNQGQETPIQEAVSLVTIAAILLGVGCYLAAIQGWPIASPTLLLIAVQVYHFFPALSALRSPQIPMLVSAAAVGGGFWLIAIPFAGVIAGWFNASQIGAIERQTRKLKRNRAKIVSRRRDRDSFDVS